MAASSGRRFGQHAREHAPHERELEIVVAPATRVAQQDIGSAFESIAALLPG